MEARRGNNRSTSNTGTGVRSYAAIGQFPGLDDEPADHHGFVIITADSAGGW